jgi:hypothetical protein
MRSAIPTKFPSAALNESYLVGMPRWLSTVITNTIVTKRVTAFMKQLFGLEMPEKRTRVAHIEVEYPLNTWMKLNTGTLAPGYGDIDSVYII